jgi:hypothetical protein
MIILKAENLGDHRLINCMAGLVRKPFCEVFLLFCGVCLIALLNHELIGISKSSAMLLFLYFDSICGCSNEIIKISR